MSSTTSAASSPGSDTNVQENGKNKTVLQDLNEESCKSQPPKRPANDEPARSSSPPLLTKAVYNLFVSAVKYGEPAYPLTHELRKLGFPTSKGITERRRFKKILPRFSVKITHGPLVFSPNSEEDVLVHKRTGKIVVPAEDIEKTVMRAHLWGSNESKEGVLGQAARKHYSLSRTILALEEHYSITRREFGISRSTVASYISRCKDCDACLSEDETPLKKRKKGTKCLASLAKLPVTATTASNENDKVTSKSDASVAKGDRPPSAYARFVSMAAHIPDKGCIWYDRQSIADTINRFDKLMMVLGEMRGEMGLAVKGNAEAKQRLEAKLYCAQLLIKEHAQLIQKSLILEECPRSFRTQLLSLKEAYKDTGQSNMFRSDVQGLLTHVKTHRLVLSPLLVRELDDFVQLENENLLGMQDVVR